MVKCQGDSVAEMTIDDNAQQFWIDQLKRDIRRLDGRIDNLQDKLIVWPTNEARQLDTVFSMGNDSPAFVAYVVELDVTAPLLSSQDVRVRLLHDEQTTPTTQDGEAYLKSAQLAGLSLVSLNTISRQVIVAWIPAGHNVLLSTSGAGTATLISSTELVFDV